MFMSSLFDKVGEKIKALAKCLFFLEVVGAVVTGIIMMFSELFLIGLAIIVGGALAAYISALFVYGFGEIIETVDGICTNTYYIHNKLPKQSTK